MRKQSDAQSTVLLIHLVAVAVHMCSYPKCRKAPRTGIICNLVDWLIEVLCAGYKQTLKRRAEHRQGPAIIGSYGLLGDHAQTMNDGARRVHMA